MYLAIRDDTIRGAGYVSLKEGLKDLGIGAIEIAYKRDDEIKGLNGESLNMKNESDKKLFKSQLDENKIKVCAFLMSNNFKNKNLEEELSWAIRCIECAEELGIKVVRIDAVMEGEKNISFEEAKTQAVKCLKYIIERTKETSVELAIENHGFQGNNPEFLEGVIKGVNSPRLGITMDTGNFYWSGKPLEEVYEILKHFAPYTKHTHVKNIKYPQEVRNQKRNLGWEYGKYVSPIFEGDIDHKKVVNFLKNARYEEDFTIEDESLGKFKTSEERIEILKKDVEYLKSII